MQNQILDLQRRLAAAEARIAELERRERAVQDPVVWPSKPMPQPVWVQPEPWFRPPYIVTCGTQSGRSQ